MKHPQHRCLPRSVPHNVQIPLHSSVHPVFPKGIPREQFHVGVGHKSRCFAYEVLYFVLGRGGDLDGDFLLFLVLELLFEGCHFTI